MSNEGKATITTHDGEWVLEWAGYVGVAYQKGDNDARRVNISGDAIETKGCIPRSVVEALFARVER